MTAPASAAEREPVYVYCTDCGHEWVGMYTPLPIDVATVLPEVWCRGADDSGRWSSGHGGGIMTASAERDTWFRVEVCDHDGQIVAIEPGMLAGRRIDTAERAKVFSAIASLSGLIGLPFPRDPSAEAAG